MPEAEIDSTRRDSGATRLRAIVLVVSLLLLSPAVLTPASYGQETPPSGDDTATANDAAIVPSDEADPASAEEGDVVVSQEEVQAQERTKTPRPWAFNLGLYLWLPGVYAEVASGPYDASISESIVDIFEATDGIPLTAGGRVEGWWERVGLYADGNVFYLDFKDQTVNGVEAGVLTRIGLLEYSAMVRVTGAPLPSAVATWAETEGPPRVDLYVGGRTLWLKNEIDPEGLPSASSESTRTSPLVGGRVAVDLAPRWFFLLDGNVGGFGVDHVDFTGEGLAAFGYRTRLFGATIALSLGYKVLYLKVDTEKRRRSLGSDTVLHGPALELTFAF